MIYQPPPYRRNYQSDTRPRFYCVGVVKETNHRAKVSVRNRKYRE